MKTILPTTALLALTSLVNAQVSVLELPGDGMQPSLLPAGASAVAASKGGGGSTGPQIHTCASLNPNGGTIDSSRFWSPSVISAHRVVAPEALLVKGFDAYMELTGQPVLNFTAFLWTADAAGRPQNPPVRSGTIQAFTTQFCRVNFTTPVAIGSGQIFFIGYQASSSTTPRLHAMLTSGSPGTYYWGTQQPPTTGPVSTFRFAWRVYCEALAQYAPYGSGCAGSRGQLVLGSLGVPRIGNSFLITLSGARAASAFGLILGSSRSTWGTIPLPLDLNFFGAPTCSLHASFDLVLAGGSTGTGNAAVSVVLPNSASLIEGQFFNQFFVLDSGVNQLGVVFSNGGAATIGR